MRWELHQHHVVRDRTRQGLPAAMLGTVPTTDTRTALCYLTPAPRIARRGESSLGPCSLIISVQDQLLPPSLGSPLQGLGSLGICAHRAPHDGSASAPTEPRLFTLSTYSDRYVVRHALCQAITRGPTSHRIRRDRHIALVHRGQDRSIDHATTVTGYRARHTTFAHEPPRSEHMYRPCPPPSTIKGSDWGHF